MMWFSRKRHLDEDFPLDRFQAANWAAWLTAARWQPADDNGYRGMVITIPQDNGEFAFEMPAAWVENDTLPPLLRDILTQLNDIDNIVQRSCRERALRHKHGSYDTICNGSTRQTRSMFPQTVCPVWITPPCASMPASVPICTKTVHTGCRITTKPAPGPSSPDHQTSCT